MPTKSNNIGGRGGARPGAGRKKKPLNEKVETGNPGGRVGTCPAQCYKAVCDLDWYRVRQAKTTRD